MKDLDKDFIRVIEAMQTRAYDNAKNKRIL